jgi:hypothetical protein
VSDQDIFFKTGLGTSVAVTTPIGVSGVGPVGPVTVAGIPDTFHINIDNVAKITLGIDPVHVALDSLPKISLGFDPVELKITQLPSIRGHLPADFSVGFSVLGMELACVRLCGEAQIITEPYHPNPCEHCGEEVPDVPGTPVSG